MLALRVGACKRFFAAITTSRRYRSLQSDLSCGMNRNTWHTPSHAPTGMQTLDQLARLRVIVLSSLLCRPSSSSPGRSTQFDSCAIPISRTGASSRRLTVSRRRGLLALCVPPARLLVRPAHERAQLREKSSVSPIDGRVPVLTPLREIGARLRPCQSDRRACPRSYPFSRGNRYAYVRNVTHLYPVERAPRTAIYCKPRCRPSTPVVPS
jgi:hypothetical protein